MESCCSRRCSWSRCSCSKSIHVSRYRAWLGLQVNGRGSCQDFAGLGMRDITPAATKITVFRKYGRKVGVSNQLDVIQKPDHASAARVFITRGSGPWMLRWSRCASQKRAEVRRNLQSCQVAEQPDCNRDRWQPMNLRPTHLASPKLTPKGPYGYLRIEMSKQRWPNSNLEIELRAESLWSPSLKPERCGRRMAKSKSQQRVAW